jgi:hypothetical protein
MSLEADDIPEPFGIDHFADDAHRLAPESFLEKHGDAFLVRRGPLEAGRRPLRPQRTMVIENRAITVAMTTKGPPANPNLVVIAVQHTGRSPYPSMITVGRTRNNDVILADVVVSKFHAYFKEEGGKLLLQDSDSRNGTWLDGKPVPNSKQGKPVEIQSGAKIKFGLLDFWFLDAAALQDLVRRACPPA